MRFNDLFPLISSSLSKKTFFSIQGTNIERTASLLKRHFGLEHALVLTFSERNMLNIHVATFEL